ncbi:MAG: hypothetical protein QM564_08735 [Bergeyella sp.]
MANFVRNVVFDKKDYNGLYPRMTDWDGTPLGGEEGQNRSVNAIITLFGGFVSAEANIVKQTPTKIDFLFSNRNDAMNWARNQLGHNTEKMFNESGKWIGWKNSKGSVYWGHGDWGKGVGSSTFPHLNYKMTGGTKGHLFLENKIKNRGMWGDFTNYFNLGK